MLEKEVEDPVCRYARSKGLTAYKFTSPNRRSVPDRLFTGNGALIFFIEFKAPGKKPSPKQWRQIRRLQDQGFHVYVCDDIEIGKWLIDNEIENAAQELPDQGD